MRYLAAYLNSGGGVVKNEQGLVMNLDLGEYETEQLAIDNACEKLNCQHTINGVIVKGGDTGGFMVVNAQEFEEL
ncbi:hypothetical protein [Vibrio sp. 10N.261.55.A7]|uniref:hypothetical protein n=1 Tax=Vibrio sp. 10N.261.55.A7 TaxID=1880851 RepID=UPI000C83F338|nr:hypothetical protein [Vibrio sp. 10N.261.55.A7]PMJ92841.1 hypothetical protein BCU12_06780 [Vibrio sp. 10N.261.55.A7]